MILHVLIAMIAGWLQRHQQQVIAYLQEENRVLKAPLGPQRLRLPSAVVATRPGLRAYAGREVVVGVRPEAVAQSPDGPIAAYDWRVSW